MGFSRGNGESMGITMSDEFDDCISDIMCVKTPIVTEKLTTTAFHNMSGNMRPYINSIRFTCFLNLYMSLTGSE